MGDYQFVALCLEMSVSRALCCVFGLLSRYVQKFLGSKTYYFVVTLIAMNGSESVETTVVQYGRELLVLSEWCRWFYQQTGSEGYVACSCIQVRVL